MTLRIPTPALFAVLLTAACLLPGSASRAQAVVDPGVRRIASQALRSDAAHLRTVYEALHPGLYRYVTPDELAARFAELDRALDHDQTIAEAFLAFTRFTAAIRCGHSYPNFYNQPRAVVEVLTRGSNRLPFHFVWLDGRMVVTTDHSGDPALARGTIVDAIDGVPVASILANLMPLVRADGHNDAKRIDALQVQGLDRFEAFDVYYPLLYPDTHERFVLDVRATPDASSTRITVAGQTHAMRLAQMKSAGPDTTDSPLGWTLRFTTPDLAVLTMPSWAAYDDRWDWKAWVRQVFETLQARGTSRLVIDLRGNEGGRSVGDEITAHLIDAPLVGASIERRTRYRNVPVELRPMLDTWDPSFLDWGDTAIGPDARGFYRLTKYDDGPEGSVIAPQSPRYRGRVDVLVDASNSSATFEFAELVQRRGLARLVGRPTGGNLRGINGGAFFFLRLPASRIEIDVPLIAQVPKAAMPDRGLQPDVLVAARWTDIRDGRDAAMRLLLDEADTRSTR